MRISAAAARVVRGLLRAGPTAPLRAPLTSEGVQCVWVNSGNIIYK